MFEDLNEKDISVLLYIREHSNQKGYPPSVREICKKLDIKSTSTVFSIMKRLEENNYIRKDPSKPRAIEILDKSYDTPTDISRNLETISLPVVGQIAAGSPILAEENIEEYFPIPASFIKGNNSFMLVVRGDSMIDVGIFDKDYIIVNASDIRPQNGKIIAALIDGESATVKTFHKKGDKIILKPENQSMDPMIYDASQVSILGTVTGVFRNI